MGRQRCQEKYLLKFPAYYSTLPCNCPKESAVYIYNEFEAYRACLSDEIGLDDFKSYYELGIADNEDDASSYSISIYTDDIKPRQMVKSQRFKSIAKGTIKDKNGPVNKSKVTSHVDWWLFKDANPIIDFEVIP